MSGKDEVVIFLQQLHKVISKVGLPKVLSRITEITLDDKSEIEREVCEQIITICANHYLVEKDDILVSRKRGKVSEARRMCFALMKRNLEITDGSIGDYVGGRSKQFVHNELKNITLDEKKFETKKQLGFYKDFIKLNDELLIVRNSNYKKTSK
jgi:chromosomal replication initiation ATPase DnaA